MQVTAISFSHSFRSQTLHVVDSRWASDSVTQCLMASEQANSWGQSPRSQRGHPRLPVEPVWCREAISTSPKLSQGHPPSVAVAFAFCFETSVFGIPLDHVNMVKNQFWRETGQQCSTFDVVTAVAWQCRTRAIGLQPYVDVHLGFAANTRHLLRRLLPQASYTATVSTP